MTSDTQSKLAVKLFIGCLLTLELKQQLHKSFLWKQIKIDPNHPEFLTEVRHEKKDYIGRYIDNETITLKELKQLEKHIDDIIVKLCPETNQPPTKVVFPQVLIF